MSALKKTAYNRSQLVFYLAGLLPTARKEALAVIDTLGRVVVASGMRGKRKVRVRRHRAR